MMQAPGDDHAVQRLQHSVQHGHSATEELDMSTAYGHTLRCQLSVSPLASDSTPGGAPTTYVGVLVNSTARGRSSVAGGHWALEGHLAGAEDLFSNTEVGLLVTDPTHPDNIIIYANAGFEKLTGVSRLICAESVCFTDAPTNCFVSPQGIAAAKPSGATVAFCKGPKLTSAC